MKSRFIITNEANPQEPTRRNHSRFFNPAWLMVVLISLTMWQCKNDDYKETTGICPEVVSTVPANNAINVVANKPITVTFNETMNASTISTSTFLVNQGPNAVAGVVTPANGEAITFTFTPTSPLAPFTVYTGTMKKGVKDPMNNMLQEDYIWSFTTQPLLTLSSNPLLGGIVSGGGLYDEGTTVTAKVVPNAGYVFASWTENGTVVSTNANYAFEIEGNRTLVANFTAQYTVQLSSLPMAGGTTSGAGTFNANSSVTITAVPSVGYTFTNWTEGTNAISALKEYTFPITSSRVLVANFGINMYLLTVTSLNGTVAKLPNQTTFGHGTSVQLTATPAAGYTFTSWTGDVTGTSNSATVVMNSDKNVTANYTAIIPKYTVATSSNPLLSGTTTGGGTFNSGSPVTISAVPAIGYTFTNWTEGTNIVSANANYTFNLAGNRTLVANFAPVQFTVVTSSLPLLGGTTTGGGSFESGESVTVRAVNNLGYTFTNWTEGANIVSTNANYTFNVSANRNFVANFAPVSAQYTVATSSLPLLGGTTTGGGSFDSGASVTVRAMTNLGYTFTNWTEGANIVSTNAIYTFNINANKTLVANFAPVTAQLTVVTSSLPLLGGTTTGGGSFDSGESVTVRAVNNLGYTFTNWTEGANIVSTNANYTFNVSANRNFVANFAPVLPNQFLVGLSSNPMLGGTTDGEGLYNSGALVTLSALANNGYTFKNWTEGTNIVSTNANYTFNIMANKTFVANFTANLPQGPQAIDLGSAGDFTALAKTGVSTTGVTSVGGDVGVSPAAASFITGFGLIMDTNGQSSHTPIVTGKVYAADYAAPTPAKMTTAVSDMETAFTTANNLVVPAPIVGLYSGDISGRTLPAGLYKWSTGVLITNAGVTLEGGANDVWIFQIAQNLTVNNSAIITLKGGAQAKNIFWVVTGQATLGTNTDFSGIILSKTLISLNTGARVTGKLLAQTAVTLNASTVVEP